jgi:hypothetical protein
MQTMYMAKMGLKNSSRVSAWTVAGIIVAAALIAVVAGYAVHKLRMRHVMQNEIRDIMCVSSPASSKSHSNPFAFTVLQHAVVTARPVLHVSLDADFHKAHLYLQGP